MPKWSMGKKVELADKCLSCLRAGIVLYRGSTGMRICTTKGCPFYINRDNLGNWKDRRQSSVNSEEEISRIFRGYE